MSAFYLEQLERAHHIDAADRADACRVCQDVSDSPCAGHPLPWLSARCIRCGHPTTRHAPAPRPPATHAPGRV